MFDIRLLAAALLLASCSSEKGAPPPENAQAPGADVIAAVSAADLPPEVTRVVEAAVPGIRINQAERKEREGRIYFDVEGVRPDGSEVELDLLGERGAFKVVEIQRDLKWSEVPADARAAAKAAPNAFDPVRVIESRETDGSVIYELFAQGKPDKPALEVRVANGKAEILKEAWPH